MLRAIIVNVGTVAGVSAALLYQPQADVLEFAGDVLSGGADLAIEQEQSPGPDQPNDSQNESSEIPNAAGNGQKSKDKTKNQNTAKPKSSNKPKNKDKGGSKTSSPKPSSSSSSSSNPSPSHSSSNPEPTPTKSETPTPTPTPKPTKTPTPTPTPKPTKTPTPTPTPTQPPADKDGTYVGAKVDVIYNDDGSNRKSGTLNIKVVIKNNKVADIIWTEYPTGEHLKYTNHAYTQTAKPLIGLTVADLKAKKINTKTGATGTSTAFVKSLAAVLQKL